MRIRHMKGDVPGGHASATVARRLGQPALPGLRAGPRPAGIPGYLLRSYWWAYLWPPAVWFFDHQPVINTILFGNYRRLMDACVGLLDPASAGKTLQLAAVYGVLTPTLARRLDDGALHLADVAPIQLEVTRRKVAEIGRRVELLRANVEALPCRGGSFDTVLLFFLLHELPADARRRVLGEAVRVLRPGGSLVIADYGELRRPHPLHRFRIFRGILERAEPFLGGFWREDLDRLIGRCAAARSRASSIESAQEIFRGFYRVRRYRIG